MLTFQEGILKLQQYWASQGALIWQPYSEKVGAGTMNPATFLRVLGPEPWNVAYVEPSYRPDDGRYADNPNRMQMHTQFQVILKPDPGDPQERYLRSLEAIGINRNEHDIRFVEDNWESPALGAWGLGWEVWLDGQEITQFTYFQQAGGVVLEVPAVEITYGLERIVMFLQEQRSVWDMQWDANLTYGDVLRDQEIDYCRYDFEMADIDRLGEMYDVFEQEAVLALERGLVVPALDYILRCSHTFNVLDARGTVGVTERAVFFKRMRDLARRVAEAYLAQRDRAGYPWMQHSGMAPGVGCAAALMHLPLTSSLDSPAFMSDRDAMVFELGAEELPPEHLQRALEQLNDLVSKSLDAVRLEYTGLHIWGTPRRLTVVIDELHLMQTSEELLVKGPPAKAAFDSEGQPTRAAIGFARSKGVDLADLQVRDLDGGQYAVALQKLDGKPAVDILAELLPTWAQALRFPRSMRWNESGVAFSRPIRWLLAMVGETVVPFSYAGVESGRLTFGPRPAGSPEIALSSASDYVSTLQTYGVILDQDARIDAIREQVQAVAREVNGTAQLDDGLLQEVTHLVEVPTAILGSFEKRFLALPQDVLIAVMKKHQRYFPVRDQRGRLMPYFVTIRNGSRVHADKVVQGNEDVIRARYADAAYFYNQDNRQPLESFRTELATLTFQAELGSMLEKSHRLEQVATWLGTRLGLDTLELDAVIRAAFLSKADLATKMVVEMTSLQGIMGREYAKRSGESPMVAQGLFEQYLPRQTGDALPKSNVGRILGIADRVDSLVGLFSVGMAPTGSTDPYGLRRVASGLVQILADVGWDLSITSVAAQAAEGLPFTVGNAVIGEVAAFVTGRQRVMLRSDGYRYDSVEAVLNAQGDSPATVPNAVERLEAWQAEPDWSDLLAAYARCARIVRDHPRYDLDESALKDKAEKQLCDMVLRTERRTRREATVDVLMAQLRRLMPLVNVFFEETMVMVDDVQLRTARLAMLQKIARLPDDIVDLSMVEGF